MEFFDKRFFYVEKAFGIKSDSSADKETDGAIATETQTKKKTWIIKFVNSKQLTENQRSLIEIYYWAGYYGNAKIVDLFLEKMGISPFIKIFRN